MSASLCDDEDTHSRDMYQLAAVHSSPSSIYRIALDYYRFFGWHEVASGFNICCKIALPLHHNGISTIGDSANEHAAYQAPLDCITKVQGTVCGLAFNVNANPHMAFNVNQNDIESTCTLIYEGMYFLI